MATHALQQQLRGESRALVLSERRDVGSSDHCVDVLGADTPGEKRVVHIAYGEDPSVLVEEWEQRHDARPASLAVICPTEAAPPESSLPEDVHVTGVDATDLTGLSIAVSRYLDQWEHAGPVTVCFHSLGPLLDHAERDRVFRFLHTLTGRFMAANATAHVHLDPAATDQQTVATLSTLFDTVVRAGEDGWTVAEE